MQSTILLRSAQAVRQSTRFWKRSQFRNVFVSNTRSGEAESGGRPGIEPPDVQRLAQLAQVGVTASEAAEWGPKIEGILDWFGELQQIDLEGVPPALRADLEDSSHLREDNPQKFEAL